MKMDVRMLACVVIMAGGVMNVLPWGGPTARVASALHVDVSDIFLPLIPSMIATAAWVVFVAYRFGLKERDRLAKLPVDAIDEDATASEILAADVESHVEARRPRLFWFNLALTFGLLVMLVMGVMQIGRASCRESVGEYV